MNCQAFRSRKFDALDDATLSHLETCDDCLLWMEEKTANDEEVRFLKDFPQPAVELEERIMQSIYKTIGKSSVPLAVAEQSVIKQPKKMKLPFSPFAWAGAAAILLVVGILSTQAMQNDSSKSGSINSAASSAESTTAAQNDQQSADETIAALVPDAAVNAESSTKQGSAAAATEPKDKQQSNQNNTNEGVQKDSVLALEQQPAELPARASKNELEPSAKAPAALVGPPNPETAELADSKNNAEIAMTAPEANAKQPSFAAMGAPEDVHGQPSPAAADQSNEQSLRTKRTGNITYSTFTDVPSAVQASDLSVPVATKLPEGFHMSDISLRYESETSKQVNQLQSTYRRGDDFFTIEVLRNHPNKRALSIPGTFADRKLFTVGGNEAIGVTYDPASQPAEAQHVIHFETTQKSVPLYVIVSVKGISLTDAIDVTKQMTWQ